MHGRQGTYKEVSQPVLQSREASRLRLVAERRKLIGAITENTLPGCASDESAQESDYASIDQIRDVEYSHREALSRRLHIIDDALGRIAAGIYGLCTECGVPIAAKRLASDPAVPLCVGCQAAFESDTSPSTL
jgi:RNA polymerase-binding transcription factor